MVYLPVISRILKGLKANKKSLSMPPKEKTKSFFC
jgi:hypothetical protein